MAEEEEIDEDAQMQQRIKLKVKKSIKRIFTDHLESLEPLDIDPACVDVMAEQVHDFLQQLAQDTTMFSKHARRSTVTGADVLMCCRKNDKATQLLQDLAEPTEAPSPKRTPAKPDKQPKKKRAKKS